MEGRKCPFFTRRVGAYNWSGIKCTSPKWHTGIVLGKITEWGKEKREEHIVEFCDGDFEKCNQYKNHTNGLNQK